jgi:hypothetical protein
MAVCRASLSCACIREPSHENNLYILAVLFFEGGGFDLSASTAIIPQDDLFESPSRILAFQASQAIINLPHGLLFEPRQTLFEFRRFARLERGFCPIAGAKILRASYIGRPGGNARKNGAIARKSVTHPRLRGREIRRVRFRARRLGLVWRAEWKYAAGETGGLGNSAGISGEEYLMNSNNSNRRRAASARGFVALCAITPLAALGILAGTVPAARAADTTCPPAPTGPINGNLVVPAGNNSCTLANVTVTGNVQVGKGASLLVEPNPGQTVTIGGNVQAAQCQSVVLEPIAHGAISVGGNVQIQNCTGQSGYNNVQGVGTVTISGNFACGNNSAECVARSGNVRGNVQINNNSGGAFVLENNVGGNAQVNNNSGSTSLVSRNTIGGNLQCAGNTPGVTDGGSAIPNTVAGNKQGQCAGANF